MRAYATHRPLTIGTWPTKYSGKVKNFDGYEYCAEIHHRAFGYVDFDEEVPLEVLDQYDLVVPRGPDPKIERIAEMLVGYIDDDEKFNATWNRANELGYDGDEIAKALNRRLGF